MLLSMPSHPCGIGTQVSAPVVEGSTRNDCGGVPTLSEKVDQLPSSPSQFQEGETENGAGTAAPEALMVHAGFYTAKVLQKRGEWDKRAEISLQTSGAIVRIVIMLEKPPGSEWTVSAPTFASACVVKPMRCFAAGSTFRTLLRRTHHARLPLFSTASEHPPFIGRRRRASTTDEVDEVGSPLVRLKLSLTEQGFITVLVTTLPQGVRTSASN